MSSGVELQHVARKRRLAIGHVVLQMHDALGPSGRAGRIHPERHLVAVGVGLRQIGRKVLQPCIGDKRLRHGVIACRAIDDDQRVQWRVLAGDGIEADAKFRIRDCNRRARIREIELQQVRRRHRADQQRHEAGANRAEERGRVGRRIVEEHQDAVAAMQPQRLEAVAPLRGLAAKLGIAARAAGPGQRQAVAAAVDEIIEQDTAGVVAFRNRKPDLARAGIIGGTWSSIIMAGSRPSLPPRSAP